MQAVFMSRTQPVPKPTLSVKSVRGIASAKSANKMMVSA
jgi:hypothetical protein